MKKKLYESVRDDILGQINSGALAEGDRLPTEMELTAKYNVSRITVNKALKELKSNKIIKSNTKNGTFVCQSAEKQYSHLLIPFVGILPTTKNLNTQILDGIQKVATTASIVAPFYNTNNSLKQEREILKKLLTFNIDALIVYPCLGNENIDLLSLFAIKQIPLVFIDRKPRGFTNTIIKSNNFKALFNLVQAFIDRGYRRIATAILAEGSFPEQERFDGYVSALIKNGIPLRADYFFGDSEMYSKYHKKTLYQRLSFLETYCDVIVAKYEALSEKPEIICCANDNDALNIYLAFKRKYGKLPNDLILTGFDNLGHKLIEDFPTIEQNFFSLGKIAAEVALQQIAGKKPVASIEIDTKLIFKDSSVPVAGSQTIYQ